MSRGIITDGNCDLQLLASYLSRYWNRKITVLNATVDRACPKGNNFASEAWRVFFKFKDGNDDRIFSDSVIIKTRYKDEQRDAQVHGKIAFKNEVQAYEKIIPTLNEYINVPLRVPGYIYGDLNAIVLEDMCESSFYHNTKKVATDWSQIWSPMQEMAKLHAASIIMDYDDKPGFEKLVKGISAIPFEETTELGKKQRTSLENIMKILDQTTSIADGTRHKKILEIMTREDLWLKQKDIIEEKAKVRVINHGAVWINNYMYRNDIVTLLDWQDIKYTTPAIDLGYFLYSNLDVDFLTRNKKDLIRFYLMQLHHYIFDSRSKMWNVQEMDKMLKKLNYHWIESELNRCLLHSYMMAMWITPVYSWSEAVYDVMEKTGGIENMQMADRLKSMTPEQKDRMIKLTQIFMKERSIIN